jgi:hypothetical protein
MAFWKKQARSLQGGLLPTHQQATLAISGNGFFELREPETERRLYTRLGLFGWSADGCLEASNGWRVQGYNPGTASHGDVRLWGDGGKAAIEAYSIDSEGNLFVRHIDGTEWLQAQVLLAPFHDILDLEEVLPYHFSYHDFQTRFSLMVPGKGMTGRIQSGAIEALWEVGADVPDSLPDSGALLSTWGTAGRNVEIDFRSRLGVPDSGSPGPIGFNSPPRRPHLYTFGPAEFGQFSILPSGTTSEAGFFRLRLVD